MVISPLRQQSRYGFLLSWALIGCAAFVVGSIGCQRRDEIRAYAAPKDDVPAAPSGPAGPTDGALGSLAGPVSETSPAATSNDRQRMLAAMIPEGTSSAWFFKMTGGPSQVAAQVKDFKSLVRSVRFEEGKLQFQVPAGWERQAGSGMRFATLTCGSAEAPLETSVIRLGVRNANWNTYVLENVNRWRGQLGLAPVTLAQLPEATETLEAGNLQVTLLDIEGAGAEATAGMRRPPFAGAPATARQLQNAETTAATGRASPGFTFEAPRHWKAGRTGGMRKAAFQLQQNDSQAEVTVITLGLSGGEMLSNVNRWRKQVGLEPLNQDQLDQFVATVAVGGAEGWLVRCLDDEQPQAILAAVVTQGGQSWFFKLMGDRQLVDAESDNFEKFLESVKFGEN